MSPEHHQSILELAHRQYGAVSRTQLGALGLSTGEIRSCLNSGLLLPVHRGIYSVGRRLDRTEGWLMAAVLAAGPGSAASRRSAAVHWNISKKAGPIEIVRPYNQYPVPPESGTQTSGRKVVVYRSRLLPDSEITKHRGIPTTTVSRTLLDLAPGLSETQLREVFNDAARKGMIDFEDLTRVLERGHGWTGIAALRALADEWHPDDADATTELESRFIRICLDAGLRRPDMNVGLLGYKVDCLWRKERVVVELDSVGFHSQPSDLDADRERDIVLRQNQFEVLRFTHRRIKSKPGWVAAVLQHALLGGHALGEPSQVQR